MFVEPVAAAGGPFEGVVGEIFVADATTVPVAVVRVRGRWARDAAYDGRLYGIPRATRLHEVFLRGRVEVAPGGYAGFP